MKKKKGRVKKVLLIILGSITAIGFILLVRFLILKQKYPMMTFIGHASVKIRSIEGKVIYIDPYFPVGDYFEPADYILITHEHQDHNKISKCKQADDCKIIRVKDAIVNGEYQIFEDDTIRIEPVPSGGNGLHNLRNSVGYIVTVNGVSVYHAGDTSYIDEMESTAKKQIDYALYPVDGRYTMTPKEASEVADFIGATHNIPIHGDSDHYSKQRKEFSAKGKLKLHIAQTIFLRGSK